MASATFTAVLDAGKPLFEEARFHRAHEVWESGWRRALGVERRVLQVLVLWAAALHHHQQGNAKGASRLLLRALEYLGRLDVSLGGLDLEGLREALVTSLERTRAPWADDAKPSWPWASSVVEVELEQVASCPYCGEAVTLTIAPEDAEQASYVEDCPVCCRPWQVSVVTEGASMHVSLERDEA
jgi:predicted metal-dependent hydrolase